MGGLIGAAFVVGLSLPAVFEGKISGLLDEFFLRKKILLVEFNLLIRLESFLWIN